MSFSPSSFEIGDVIEERIDGASDEKVYHYLILDKDVQNQDYIFICLRSPRSAYQYYRFSLSFSFIEKHNLRYRKLNL